MARVCLTGDGASIQEVKALNLQGITIVDTRHQADGVIVCEGKEMPFIQVIETMKQSPGTNYNIHARGSSGVVGDLLTSAALEQISKARKNK
jgi:hypothetical protein